MWPIPRPVLLPLFILICVVPCGFSQPAIHGDGLDALVGEPADVGLSAISYRADRRQGRNPTETQWLTSGQDGTLCGLMWEEMRYLTEVKLQWPVGTQNTPAAADLLLETWGMNTSYHSPPGPRTQFSWWLGEWKIARVEPVVEDNGLTVVYGLRLPVETKMMRIRHRRVFKPTQMAVPDLKVKGPETLVWKKMQVKLEYGFGADSGKAISGSLESYNGIIGKLAPFEGDATTTIASALGWTSKGSSNCPRGIVAELLYTTEMEPTDKSSELFLEVTQGSYDNLHFNLCVRNYPMVVGDKSFKYGIGTVSNTTIRIHSPEPITHFNSWVGNDENWTTNRGRGSVNFIVKAGDKELSRTGPFRGGDQPVQVDVAVDNSNKLDLITDDNGDGQGSDQPDWGEAVITTNSGKKTRLDKIKVWYDLRGKSIGARTVITVRTNNGVFSFSPAELESGAPIYVPDYGFYITKANSETAAEQYVKQIEDLKTIRERVRQMPEQSYGRAMKATHPESVLAPYPKAPCGPKMKVEVPEQGTNDFWNLAAWHLKRRCVPREDGTWAIPDFPYPQLAQETYLIMRALDYMGFDDVVGGGIEEWFGHQGESRPYGLFADNTGATTIQTFISELHGMGPGTLLWSAAEHYFLTGDKEWLAKLAPKIEAACEWNTRQRKTWTDKLTRFSAKRSWAHGMLPPLHIGDLTAWRSWYIANAWYYIGLKSCGDALADLNPEVGKKLQTEAAQYKEDILAAIDKSVELAPVKKIQDGSHRPVLPPAPYVRGLASEILHPHSCGHGGPAWADAEFGALTLVQAQILSPFDERVDAFLDVLEDDVLYDNNPLRWRKQAFAPVKDYNPERDWFDHAGLYYQCGYLVTPIVYLMRDDIPNFLRIFYNHYALEVMPEEGYTIREHVPPHVVHDKSFEEAAFVERMRCMLVMEDDEALWLAKGTPRAWLEDGKKVSVADAPTFFGPVGYEIRSHVDAGRIVATIQWPQRKSPKPLRLRLRHPDRARLTTVTVNGRPWRDCDADAETINLHGLEGEITVEANYGALERHERAATREAYQQCPPVGVPQMSTPAAANEVGLASRWGRRFQKKAEPLFGGHSTGLNP